MDADAQMGTQGPGLHFSGSGFRLKTLLMGGSLHPLPPISSATLTQQEYSLQTHPAWTLLGNKP